MVNKFVYTCFWTCADNWSNQEKQTSNSQTPDDRTKLIIDTKATNSSLIRMANRRVISLRHLENLRLNPVGVSVFDQTERIDLQQKWRSDSRKCNLTGNYSTTVLLIFTTHQLSCGKVM